MQFDRQEYANRKERLLIKMEEDKLDALLLFAQESMYWLTDYDGSGFAFFQCLVVRKDGETHLLTRAADMRQARHTSIIENITQWTDRTNANPTSDLKDLLDELDLLGARLGIEYDTHGITAASGRLLDDQLQSFGDLVDASLLVSRLRLIKSPAELAKVRKAAELADAALDAALPLLKPGTGEAEILAAMQGAVLAGGGDYPASPFALGSGKDALLTRYKSGRRQLGETDQVTLEWAGVFAHYHAVMANTVILGSPSERHVELYEACREGVDHMLEVLKPGHTFGEVFDTQAQVMDDRGLARYRLSVCGYSLGARFAPTWLEPQLFQAGNSEAIEADMTLFVQMVIMDSEAEAAMSLGRSFLTTAAAPEPLSRHGLDLIVHP